ncbi:hypothetical protein [Porphyromonas gulae]|uniref:hypothetical protein n=1 Tax=Porphyromonas gulae TaxID=111105 RepID=UPI0012699FC1|nr:hypothetical protein [Porphyromonas gulae]
MVRRRCNTDDSPMSFKSVRTGSSGHSSDLLWRTRPIDLFGSLMMGEWYWGGKLLAGFYAFVRAI